MKVENMDASSSEMKIEFAHASSSQPPLHSQFGDGSIVSPSFPPVEEAYRDNIKNPSPESKSMPPLKYAQKLRKTQTLGDAEPVSPMTGAYQPSWKKAVAQLANYSPSKGPAIGGSALRSSQIGLGAKVQMRASGGDGADVDAIIIEESFESNGENTMRHLDEAFKEGEESARKKKG